MHGNHSVQKSLESPSNKDSGKVIDLIPSSKTKRQGGVMASNSGAQGQKKRFYNSMVVSGLISES